MISDEPHSFLSDAAASRTLGPHDIKELFKVGSRGKVTDHLAKNTARSYACSWQAFLRWCEERACSALPASEETVLAFARDCVEGRVRGAPWRRRTIGVAIAAIRHAHVRTRRALRLERVYEYLKGVPPLPSKAPVATPEDLKSYFETAENRLMALRTRCLATLIYEELLRFDELIELTVEDYVVDEEGAALCYSSVHRPDTKEWHPITLPSRQALEEWLSAAHITTGPIFRRLRPGKSSRPLAQSYVGGILTTARRRANGESVGWRALRRGHALQAASRSRRPERVEQNMRKGMSGMAYRRVDERSAMQEFLSERRREVQHERRDP